MRDPYFLNERHMLYLVRMDVHLPLDMPAARADEIKAREKAYSQEFQQLGKWQQLHRVVGEYANYSIFDVTRTTNCIPSCQVCRCFRI